MLGSVDGYDLTVRYVLSHKRGSSNSAYFPGARMDELLKEVLGTVTLKKTGKGGGGCINEGEAYLIDTGTVFVKYNKKPQVNQES
jgi:hypothetical protein